MVESFPFIDKMTPTSNDYF